MRHKDVILFHKIIPGAGILWQFIISGNNHKIITEAEELDEADDAYDDEDDVLRSLK